LKGITAGMSTEYLTLLKATASGAKGRTIPFLLSPGADPDAEFLLELLILPAQFGPLDGVHQMTCCHVHIQVLLQIIFTCSCRYRAA
jgi:hypothetical protein